MSISVISKIRTGLWMLVIMHLESTTALWYNRPTFSSCASWNPNAITFADSGTLGSYTHGVFVDINNTVYAGSWYSSVVKVWVNASSTATRTITNGLYGPYSLFVAENGDIYIDNGLANGRVDKWTLNATSGVNVVNISSPCYGLSIDTNMALYCSFAELNMVVKTDLTNTLSMPKIIAGNGSTGSTSILLTSPWGIFVDTDFTLYVADCNNNRIQRFKAGELIATTVAGSTAPGTISLLTPTGVVLDANGYLFIMDTNNYRIVASSAAGFRCIAGCSGASGSTADKLYNARYMAFDPYGNMYVSDDDNHRIQKFILASNSCMTKTTRAVTNPTPINIFNLLVNNATKKFSNPIYFGVFLLYFLLLIN